MRILITETNEGCVEVAKRILFEHAVKAFSDFDVVLDSSTVDVPEIFVDSQNYKQIERPDCRERWAADDWHQRLERGEVIKVKDWRKILTTTLGR